MIKGFLVLALVASAATAMEMPAVLQSEEHPLQGLSCNADSTLGECLGQLKMRLTGLRQFLIEHHRQSNPNGPNILKGLPHPLKCILKGSGSTSAGTEENMPAVFQSEEHPLQGFSCGADSTLGDCLGALKMRLTCLRQFLIDHHSQSDSDVSNILRGLPRPLKCILKHIASGEQHAHEHERAEKGNGDQSENEEEASGDTGESQVEGSNNGPKRMGKRCGRRGERPTGETEGEHPTQETGEGRSRGGPHRGGPRRQRPTDESGEIRRGGPRRQRPTQEPGVESTAEEGENNANEGRGGGSNRPGRRGRPTGQPGREGGRRGGRRS